MESQQAISAVQWFNIAWAVAGAIIGIAVWLAVSGYKLGKRESMLDAKLSEMDKFDEKLAKIERLVEDAGKRMSDRLKGMQGIIGAAQFAQRDVEALQKEHGEIKKIVGDMRVQLAHVEARQWNAKQGATALDSH